MIQHLFHLYVINQSLLEMHVWLQRHEGMNLIGCKGKGGRGNERDFKILCFV